jgi:hypothetical protein
VAAYCDRLVASGADEESSWLTRDDRVATSRPGQRLAWQLPRVSDGYRVVPHERGCVVGSEVVGGATSNADASPPVDEQSRSFGTYRGSPWLCWVAEGRRLFG